MRPAAPGGHDAAICGHSICSMLCTGVEQQRIAATGLSNQCAQYGRIELCVPAAAAIAATRQCAIKSGCPASGLGLLEFRSSVAADGTERAGHL